MCHPLTAFNPVPDFRDTQAASTENGKELVAAGVKLETVNYDEPSTVESALRGVDVVVSTLSGPGIPVQSKLIDAAKKVGVKLFVPRYVLATAGRLSTMFLTLGIFSEFGNDVGPVDSSSPLYGKKLIRNDLKEKNVPYLLIVTGPFANWIGHFIPYVTFQHFLTYRN